jgi:Cu-Zn family superoxide dismutase
MRRVLGLAVIAAAGALGYSQATKPKTTTLMPTTSENKGVAAICQLHPDGSSGVSGIVYLVQDSPNSPTKIIGTINGLKQGLHGFHVHEFGDISKGCSTAGPHYNPYKTDHGGPNSVIRHVGDLGNVYADENGVAKFEIEDKLIQLQGQNSIIGRSLVVHKDEDDLGLGNKPDSKTTGIINLYNNYLTI